MVRAEIIIKLSDGTIFSYANKYLYKKAGVDKENNPLTDEATPRQIFDRFGKAILDKEGKEVYQETETPLFDGISGVSYFYTGAGNDTYDDQTNLGEVKADYEYLREQIGVVGNTYLRFPEADENHGDVTEIVRKKSSTVNGVETYARLNISVDKIVSISVSETWVNFPFGRESGYNFAKQSVNFLGFNETEERKLKDFDRGPDWNREVRFDTGYVPNPILKYDNGLVIENEKDFDECVVKETDRGYEVYGIYTITKPNGKTQEKKSGIVFLAK